MTASDLEMRPLVAHCHAGLGRLYRRTDNLEQAQDHLTTVFPVLPFEGATVTYGTRPDIEVAAAAQGLDHELDVVPR